MTALPDPEADDGVQELSDSAVVANSGSMALATLVSRITGFVKLLLITAALGEAYASAFSTANQLPNLIAALVLEATFTAIFVPVLTRAEREDHDGGEAFIRKLLTIVVVLLVATTLIAVLAAPLLSSLMLGGDPKVSEPLTTALAYLLLPQIFFYGMSSVLMAILNTRNVFKAPAWAPVWNNLVAIVTLLLYWTTPGEITLNPLRMSDPKLLVLGIGTTVGVVTQALVLVPAIRRQRIPLRPLWGLDNRLKQFAGMASAMFAYVAISQFGLVITNRIAAGAADSGPIIYNQTWMILQLPYGVIGVTVLTAIMPRLSRNAAADDTDAILADLSLATRLTMVVLVPVVAVMTVSGPAMGPALFAYGKFSLSAAGYLGQSISLSSFTLIAYALVLLQLRVFYARQEAWTPTWIIIVITAVKIVASVFAPHLTGDPDLVAGYLGAANGLGFVAGAICGHLLLRRSLGPEAGPLFGPQVGRTVLATVAASATGAAVALLVDRGLDLALLTARGGGLGSLVRLAVLGVVALTVTAGLMLAAKVPEVWSVASALQARLGRGSLTRPARPTSAVNALRGTKDNASVMGNAAAAGLTYPDSGVRGDHPGFAAGTRANSPRTGVNQRRERTVTDTPGSHTDTSPTAAVPGTRIADGRYRLLSPHGGPTGLQFWQAADTELNRPVALTIISGEVFSADAVQDILSNTLRLSKISTSGLARVLDAVHEGRDGIVVAQWVRGGSLREVADTEPSAIGASRAVRSLAQAAEAAFDAGTALSLDHPDRVRISIDGDAVLAFPATLTSASAEGDVRGLGAVLYGLTTRCWPLSETENAGGLDSAPRGPGGQPVAPRMIVPSIPAEISDVTEKALGPAPGSATDLLASLESAIAGVDHTTMLGTAAGAPTEAFDTSSRRARSADRFGYETPDDWDGSGDFDAAADDLDPEIAERRRKVFLIGLGVLAVVVVTLFVALGVWVMRIFGDVGPLDRITVGGGITTSAAPTTSARPGAPVKVKQATVFSPGGDADQPARAEFAIDGDPSTSWITDTYTDAVPFPTAFKSGVGLLLDLSSPTTLTSVTIESPSVGTHVRIYSSPSSSPASLSDTKELSASTPLKTGKTTIPIKSDDEVSHVLVWIDVLGSTDGEHRAQIDEITVSGS